MEEFVKAARRHYSGKYVKEYLERTKNYAYRFLLPDMKRFALAVNDAGSGNGELRVIDIGSGPCRDSKILASLGLNPVALDISPDMCSLCRETGVEAVVGNALALPFSDGSFLGAWAYTSLLFLPKRVFKNALEEIFRVLQPGSAFYIGMKEGGGEGWEHDARRGMERYVAYYSKPELESFLKPMFDIISFLRVSIKGRSYISFLCKRRQRPSI